MSALDPTAAALLAAINNADTALLETVLDLGVCAQVLQAQISVGDVLPALVLKPLDGADAIEIGGQRVTAQLPPDVRPGQTLVLQVTSFDGNRIVVRNLGPVDPRNAPPPLLLTPEQAQPGQGGPPAVQAAQTAAQQRGPLAPPGSVFVAASLRAAPFAAPPAAIQTPRAPSPPLSAQPAQPGVLDAKIAAAQTPRIASTIQATRSAMPPPAAQSAGARTIAAPPVLAADSAHAQTTSDVLRAAHLPDTAFTRTVAAIAHQAPQRLWQVLARLDQVLARVAGDPRAATVRTLAAFTGRLNLANVQILPAQIMAYVSHVVEGAESKMAALLQAYRAAAAPTAQSHNVPPSSAHLAAHEAAATTAMHSAAVQHGRIAHQSAQLEHDLKSLILSLLKDPPAQRAPAVTQALNESLITLTATQLNVLNANIENPGAIALPLPAFFYEGGKPAHVRITRDDKGGAGALDGDNFHVAFVLDTKNLGTVAVDVQTASRNVKIDVKAEHTRAASAFSSTLGSLKTRLELLRYRVSSADAQVSHKPARDRAASAPVKRERSDAQLDLHA